MPTLLRLPVVLLLAVLIADSAVAQPARPALPPEGETFATLRPEHPRLMATAEDFGLVLDKLDQPGPLADRYAAVKRQADALLEAPPSRYEIPDGKRLLATSRRVLDRTYTLALVHRVESARDPAGAGKYRDRLWRELSAAVGFKDWNPSHFLDTAEMTHAVAIGLDWLWDAWSEEQRQTLIDAIVRHGLEPGMKGYEGKIWWATSRHNWNQVCNGGLIVGALAIADERPELAEQIVRNAVERLPLALNEYGRDGGWEEGVGYWVYATNYTAYGLAALNTALGSDFGLSDDEDLAAAWQFPRHLVGPGGGVFNFADAGAGFNGASCFWWLARRYDVPAAAAFQQGYANRRPSALDVVWGARFDASEVEAPPLDMHFRDAGVVTMRSAWNDPDAAWLAIKAGRNGVNHGQLDLGSFVLEAGGVRWFVELGADNYNLPGYFGRQRWDFYRNRAEGHNTLVINPDGSGGQAGTARAEVVMFESRPGDAAVEIDLKGVYGRPVTRRVVFEGRERFIITDTLGEAEPGEVWWFAHTSSEVEVAADGRSATLSSDGKRLKVELVQPADARLKVLPAEPLEGSPKPEGQAENQGIHKLAVHLRSATSAVIEVRISPE